MSLDRLKSAYEVDILKESVINSLVLKILLLQIQIRVTIVQQEQNAVMLRA